MSSFTFFFFKEPAPPEIYTLPLHAALPICAPRGSVDRSSGGPGVPGPPSARFRERPFSTPWRARPGRRSEEHTSELQSRQYLVCRLLLEKKKKIHIVLHIDAVILQDRTTMF